MRLFRSLAAVLGCAPFAFPPVAFAQNSLFLEDEPRDCARYFSGIPRSFYPFAFEWSGWTPPAALAEATIERVATRSRWTGNVAPSDLEAVVLKALTLEERRQEARLAPALGSARFSVEPLDEIAARLLARANLETEPRSVTLFRAWGPDAPLYAVGIDGPADRRRNRVATSLPMRPYLYVDVAMVVPFVEANAQIAARTRSGYVEFMNVPMILSSNPSVLSDLLGLSSEMPGATIRKQVIVPNGYVLRTYVSGGRVLEPGSAMARLMDLSDDGRMPP